MSVVQVTVTRRFGAGIVLHKAIPRIACHTHTGPKGQIASETFAVRAWWA